MSEELHFHVSVPHQVVSVHAGEMLLWQAPVSTAAKGVGCEEGSYMTPPGWHFIAEKIGEDQPLGAVFRNRQPTGEVWLPAVPQEDQDLILTRILWLAGAEPHNANTQRRYIYFHGTNHPGKIGTPASHGCIRLRNADMVRLFDYAEVGTRVLIEA